MYFPFGWPNVLDIPQLANNVSVRQIICNRDKVLFAILTDDSLIIWFCKPCLPIVSHRRTSESLEEIGLNEIVEWRPDSRRLVVATSGGSLIFYSLEEDLDKKGLYQLVDSPQPNLRRDSAELFIKQNIPCLHLALDKEITIGGGICSIVCLRDELMVATTRSHVLRYRWDGSMNRDYCLDLRRVPFCIDQQVSKAIPLVENNTYLTQIEYSPLIGGFAVVLNDGRAAVLTAVSLKFDPNQVQGIWAPNVEDATCAAVNHKFRLITFGRKNGECIIYNIDEMTGGLEVSHQLIISSEIYPGPVGAVSALRWTPDGCALAVAWSSGGFSLWSTFGALLTCSLSWDYGIHTDVSKNNPLLIHSMEWSAEGYQLWMVKRQDPDGWNEKSDSVILMGFVKSALTVNPCMSHKSHLALQGEDRLYINLGAGITKVYQLPKQNAQVQTKMSITSQLVENKQWLVVLLPSTYSSTNWPIRYTAIDCEGHHLAVAGRTGLAHYSFATRRWKLFGNETQEKDMIVTGGLLWWQSYIVLGCYNLPDDEDQVRFYPREARLSNDNMTCINVPSQVLLIDALNDRLVIFCANVHIYIYSLSIADEANLSSSVEVARVQTIDITSLCVHPACVVSITLTALRTEPTRRDVSSRDSFVLNVSGRLLLVHQHESNNQVIAPTALASYVENVWVPNKFRREKPHLTEALWLFCGAHGMRVWLPLFPKEGDNSHTFMSKRIMLPFHLKIYPLAVLFEDAILLGAENDTLLYSTDVKTPFSFPFCLVERTSQVYLHQILRQLIRRNLGFHAWEIARCCTNLPYFPHCLELLLHEVLEEEATSKEPIPDAQLPSIIEFIQEFPVYLETIVQCARKTEIALWPYLFSAAGKPKDLFQKCLTLKQLETAASYLIILQNLESSLVSRQYATLLLDATLDECRWELSKDLVRFLKAIDPNDVDSQSPRTSFVVASKYGMISPPSPVYPNEEDLSLVLGTMHVSRSRSYSTANTPKLDQTSASMSSRDNQTRSSADSSSRRKKSVPLSSKPDNRELSRSTEELFMDLILQRHARKLLLQHRLSALGHFAAHLDFHLVEWLIKERERAARVDHFVTALRHLHADFSWPYPVLSQSNNFQYRKNSNTSLYNNFSNGPSGKEMALLGGSVEINVPESVIGDSGYMSCQDNFMRPLQLPSDGDCMMSEVDGDDFEWWKEEREDYTWSDMPSTKLLEQLAHQVTTRGSSKAEVQLRYLLQLFMEASCLEWSIIISVLLRDAMAVHRTTNAARSPHHSHESVLRLKQGLISLCQWSSSECMGYKPFMVAIQNQVSILNKLLATKQRVVTPPIPPTPVSRSRTTSCSDMNSQCGTIVGGATLPSSPSSVADGTTPDDGAVFNEQEDTASNISATSESPASGTAAQAESNCIIS
ncbi:guanine nucleotide exchange factor subunit Rich isoform X2 [Bemisia tabaci]|uniref:guanine nucleotide exchange factor subunit Rich isoform X2 n=1 Tax=Bemisia tabaci TaxID=7038 RepID=UPI0008F9AE30|nr:PREDICTED: guanine nucleotide exchange factor subunit Rich isoform X2 [Bemisia tabaci]